MGREPATACVGAARCPAARSRSLRPATAPASPVPLQTHTHACRALFCSTLDGKTSMVRQLEPGMHIDGHPHTVRLRSATARARPPRCPLVRSRSRSPLPLAAAAESTAAPPIARAAQITQLQRFIPQLVFIERPGGGGSDGGEGSAAPPPPPAAAPNIQTAPSLAAALGVPP